MERVDAGAEIQVGQPNEPLPEAVELALREVVQASGDVAFAYVPVIAFPGQPAGQVLVVFLRAGVDPEQALAAISAAVKKAIDKVIAANRKLKVQPLAVLPISLARPLDGLAQAVMITDTMLFVADVVAWKRAKNPKPWWLRGLHWMMGR